DCDIAPDLDILPQVEPIRRHPQRRRPNLHGFRRLHTRLVPPDPIRVPQIHVHGRVDVRLKSPRSAMETAVEIDLPRPHPAHAGDVLYPLGNLVPRRVELVCGGVAGRGDGLVVEDEGVEGDDLAVGVEDVDGELAGDIARYGGDGRVDLFFAEHCGG